MKISTTMIIVLITTTATSSCFAMQTTMPRIVPTLKDLAAMGDAKKGGAFSEIKGFLSPKESKNIHTTSSQLHVVNSALQKNLIINLNEYSFESILSRIQKTEGQLRSLIIRSNGQIETQEQIQAILLRCPNLQELNVRYCRNAVAGIAAALALDQDGIRVNPNALQRLKKLNLSLSNPSAEQIITIAQHCPALEELDISNCPDAHAGITQALEENPHALQHLKKLNLEGTNHSAEQIITIALRCPALEELNINQCQNAPAGITQALDQNPHALEHLKKLNLKGTNPSAEQITTIAAHCLALKEVDASWCQNFAAGITAALVDEDGNRVNPQALQQLTILNIGRNTTTTDLIKIIALHCPALEELDVSCCQNAPAGIAAALALDQHRNRVNPNALQHLKKLNLYNSNPTADEVTTITQHCPTLEELHLYRCLKAPAGIAQALALDQHGNRINPHALQQLKKIFLTNISEEDVAILQNRLPRVKISR